MTKIILMMALVFSAGVMAGGMYAAPALAQGQGQGQGQAFDPQGLWLTQNKRAAIQVSECNTGLCGKIAWIIEGGMQFDEKNPQENLRGQPMCGLEILKGFEASATTPNFWQGGHIYKADEGDIYNAEMTMKSAEEMELRGYVGIPLFGKSQKWTRVSATDYPACKPAQK